ncbi:MAG: hypothetical protein ACJAQT_003222 [Akkermansiaceae bacterium]|jgi:hypothetical protein
MKISALFILLVFESLLVGCQESRLNSRDTIMRMNELRSLMKVEDDDECQEILDLCLEKSPEKYKLFLEENGVSSHIEESDFPEIWKDSWGNNYDVIASNDISIIVITSNGPNGVFDEREGDDIVFLVNRKR